MTDLLIIGGGRMGEALAVGLSGSRRPGAIAFVEPVGARRAELAERYPGIGVYAAPVPAEGAVIAVKPQQVQAACEALAAAGTKRVVSIAAGVRLAELERWLPGVAVVRAMPNVAAMVGASASAISAGVLASEDDMVWAEELLSTVGTVVRLKEELLDCVTALSGSGPAYVFLLAEALTEAGVLEGLDRAAAAQLVAHTVLGAGQMLTRSGDAPEALRHQVTSPGGTTAAGLAEMERGGVRASVLNAVAAARRRSAELGAHGAERQAG